MALIQPELRGLGRRAALQLQLAVLALAALPNGAQASQPDDAKLLAALGNLVIPPTATSGAGDSQMVDFICRALAHGMDGASPVTLDDVRKTLNAKIGGNFLAADAAAQHAALTWMDEGAYGTDQAQGAPWRKIKGLILAGYYTSEVGCTKELIYELAPGRWDNDIPLKAADRAIANDWFAVSFR
jgi:hypothetical protein